MPSKSNSKRNRNPANDSESHVENRNYQNKKPNYLMIIGSVLVILGIIAFILPIFNFTTTDQLIDLGPFQATTETQRHLSIPPIVAIIFTAAGILFGALGFLLKKKK